MSRREWNPFGAAQWIAWLGATAIAATGLTVFAYREFATKAEAKESAEAQSTGISQLDRRLDRIEGKVDRILERDATRRR